MSYYANFESLLTYTTKIFWVLWMSENDKPIAGPQEPVKACGPAITTNRTGKSLKSKD